MDAARQAQVAFYLTGKRPGAELEPVEGLGLRPALLARYHDLTTLRYDYPLVLLSGASARECARPLSGLIDKALGEVAHDEHSERVSKQVLRMEAQLRAAVAAGGRASLSGLWAATAEQLGAKEDQALQDSLDRTLAALPADGELVDCDATLPSALVSHAWQVTQTRKSRQLGSKIAGLVHRVSNVLRADFALSKQGRSTEALMASMGGPMAGSFDFDALSRVLVRSAGKTAISDTRRHRLGQLIETLQSYEYRPATFRFESCVLALQAWHERFSALIDLARAVSMAELEIAGDYREGRHDVFFEEYSADELTPEDVALFADYLVCVNAATMDAGEQAALMEILSSGLPMKILVQSDDILEDALPGSGRRGFGRSAPHFANMAVGLNDVYVLQSAASHLPRCVAGLADGMAYPGTALFSVFSGATRYTGELPAYLVAAAAVESRVFPVFIYDPAAGSDWATRFSLSANPQPESDWPSAIFEYEDAERRGIAESLSFTFVDFAALDERYARHFARVPSEHRGEAMIPVSDALVAEQQEQPESLPGILMVDGQNRLQKVLVDERLLREARRCRESWHSLQELGGIHNSHAERLLAEDRRAREAATQQQSEGAPPAPEAQSAAPATEAASADSPSAEPEAELSPDDAYIETPRCTTCNECTQINDRMFAYNENQQAYIADPDAGTYAQMVEAAESCQVSIIHPGKPRNPDEPGLDELLKRAESFI